VEITAEVSQPSLEDFVNVLPASSEAVVPLVKLTPAISVSTKVNPVNCLVCKQVAKWVMTKLKDNKTEISVVEALDEVCDKIFTKGKKLDCKEFVSRYTHEIIQLIIQEDDPKTVCRLLNVCNSRIDEQPTLVERTCNTCVKHTDTFMQMIPLVGKSNITATTPLLLIYLCESLGMEQDCIEYMEKHSPFMSAFMEQRRSSRQICDAIDLCTKYSVDVAVEPVAEIEEREVESLPTCFVCKRIVKWVNHQIKDNRTEAAIEAALEDVCKFVRDIENCHLRVAAWSERLVQAMKTATDTDLTCDLMGVCLPSVGSLEREQEDEVAVTEIPTTPPSEASACYECKNIAHFIQTELYDYNKEKEIDDFVIHRVCDRVAQEGVRDTCTSFINEYGPSIMQMIAMKAFDPKIVCERDLRICPKTVPVFQDQDFEILRPTSQKTCDACVHTVKELDALLAVETIDKDIAKVAARVCGRIPADRQRQVCIFDIIFCYYIKTL
jgi:saposin